MNTPNKTPITDAMLKKPGFSPSEWIESHRSLETAAHGLRDASELIMDVKHCMMFLRIHDEQTAKEVCERHQVENVQLLAKKAQDVAEEALARFDALKEAK